jgi:hypothetical protein
MLTGQESAYICLKALYTAFSQVPKVFLYYRFLASLYTVLWLVFTAIQQVPYHFLASLYRFLASLYHSLASALPTNVIHGRPFWLISL